MVPSNLRKSVLFGEMEQDPTAQEISEVLYVKHDFTLHHTLMTFDTPQEKAF